MINYCNTGHWSSTDWFVLSEILGRKDVKLYYGSMEEWSAVPAAREFSRTKWDDIKKILRSRILNGLSRRSHVPGFSGGASAGGASARRLFLGLDSSSGFATALLIGLVLIDGQPLSAALLLLGFGLGAAFWKFEFSFTASWRRFLTRGEAGGLLAILMLIAIAAIAVVPVATSWPNFGGSIAPIGVSLIVGAFTFGVGMQLANGCGSGTLYTVGGGSGRMLGDARLFIVGSVLGSLSPADVPAHGRHRSGSGGDYFGPWGGLAVTLAQHRGCRCTHRCGRTQRDATFAPPLNMVIGGIVIALLCVAVFVAAGIRGA